MEFRLLLCQITIGVGPTGFCSNSEEYNDVNINYNYCRCIKFERQNNKKISRILYKNKKKRITVLKLIRYYMKSIKQSLFQIFNVMTLKCFVELGLQTAMLVLHAVHMMIRCLYHRSCVSRSFPKNFHGMTSSIIKLGIANKIRGYSCSKIPLIVNLTIVMLE